MRLALIALAFFVAFAAAGFSVGRSVVTSEPYMLAMIANNSSVKLSGKTLQLELGQANSQPYWSLDLKTNLPQYNSVDAILDSFNGKTLSAESNMLLTFLSGGAATTTAASVYKEALTAKKTGDLRTFAAMIVGGVSGYLAGYYSAIHLSKPSDKEIVAMLRKPETIEKVKKFVFISLFKARGLHFEHTPAEDEIIKRTCVKVDDPKDWIDCYFEALKKSGNIDRDKLKSELFRDAQRALSDDRLNLKGDEFLVFVI